jgi:hypothetical protein
MSALNYFNYYTEIEEYFWRKRGAHLLVSPLDWAIVETWQKAGVPLNAVLKGIDRAFDSYARSRRAAGGQKLKSLAYCVDAVTEAAQEAQEAAAGGSASVSRALKSVETFSREELLRYFNRNISRLQAATEKHAGAPQLHRRLAETAQRLHELKALLDAPSALDLEDLERRLTVLEDKLNPIIVSAASEALLLSIRRDMDRSLAPYRRRMSADQLAQLERQYTQKRVLEALGVPRLSLFYLT